MGTIEVEVLTGLVTNGVHGQRWPDSVYAVALYTVNGRNLNFIAWNTTKTEHAEDCVLNFFQVLLQDQILQPQVVKLFLSASPCQRCSQRIISFLSTAWWCHGIKLEMEVVISAFYRIRRPSCEQNPVCRDHLPSYEWHLAQVDGLKKLYWTPGVFLRTVELRDWMILGNVLGVRNTCFCIRIEEDFLLKKDFEQIMDFSSLIMEIVDSFVCDWPERYAYYTVVRYMRDTKTDYFIDRNKEGKHAEDFLIEYFTSLLEHEKLGSPEMKVYITNSPCAGCCRKLVDFVGIARSKYHTSLKIEIVFPSLYGVRRPSQANNPTYTGYLPPKGQHKGHVKGLKELQAANVHLKTFTKDDWQELLEATGVKFFDFNFRKIEDDLLRKDFEIIMNLNTTSLGVPAENNLTNPSGLKGTIPAIQQPKTGPPQEAPRSHQDEKNTDKNLITTKEHDVQTASQDLSSGHQEAQPGQTASQLLLSGHPETHLVQTPMQTASQDLSSGHQETQKVTCKDSGTTMTTNDTEAVLARQGETGRVNVEKGHVDKATQTEPLQNDQLTPEKVKADKETETVEKEKLEKETQSEPLQSYKTTVDKEKFEIELMELKLQVARRQHELEVEILQSKKECSRLKQIKLQYEVLKLQRQLGVPENTRIAADVLFKVDD